MCLLRLVFQRFILVRLELNKEGKKEEKYWKGHRFMSNTLYFILTCLGIGSVNVFSSKGHSKLCFTYFT